MEYVLTRSPFSEDNDLINIHTGEVAGNNVNVDKSVNVGMKIVNAMQGDQCAWLLLQEKG